MERYDHQVDLFVAILVRFPQVSAVHYDPVQKTLRLVFLLKKGEQDFYQFARDFEAHLSLFHQLRAGDVTTASLKKMENNQLTTVEVVRDLASISLVELKLIVQLLVGFYGDNVIQEGAAMEEEDEQEQNLLIDALLRSGSWRPRERLTGFRENGRVLVFSMPLEVSKQ